MNSASEQGSGREGKKTMDIVNGKTPGSCYAETALLSMYSKEPACKFFVLQEIVLCSSVTRSAILTRDMPSKFIVSP